MLALIGIDKLYAKNKLEICKCKIRRLLRIIRIIRIDQSREKIIYRIPQIGNKNKDKIKIYNKAIATKLVDKLKKEKKTVVILAKELKQNEIIKNTLYANGITILEGKWLLKFLPIYILEYVLKLQEEKIESQTISVLVNDLNEVNLKIIMILAQKVKSLHIITNHIQKFKKVENILYEEMGIVISLSSNKKKSLAKAKIILNLDFPEELVSRYMICHYSIIINIENDVKNLPKSFNGILINGCKIDMAEEVKMLLDELDEFDLEDLYEAQIFRKYNVEDTFKKLDEDAVKVQNVIGKNGFIEEQEFENIKKTP